MPDSSPEKFLRLALEQAQLRKGFCAPNPAVGAIVVREGKLIGQGTHWAAGSAHAEIEALKAISPELARQSDLYVTLEPCCHFGRTPPCTARLIERGIRSVTFAYLDPNPKVAGKGRAELIAAGIACRQVSIPEIDQFYESYAYWTHHSKPWVTVKLALSLDGKIAGPLGKTVALSSEAIGQFTHEQRSFSDAILTTERTIRADNPRLNARIKGNSLPKAIYVIDANLSLSPSAQIWSTSERLHIFCAENCSADRQREYLGRGADVIPIPCLNSRLALEPLLNRIGKDGIHDLWVESGGTLLRSLVETGQVQRGLFYLTPHWLGSAATSAFGEAGFEGFSRAKSVRWASFASDALCEVRW